MNPGLFQHPCFRTGSAAVLVAGLLAAAGLASAGETDGRYRVVSQRVDVEILSWGEDCGPRPQSSSSTRIHYAKVTTRGADLEIAADGETLQTGRCWSPNPRLQIQKTKSEGGRWVLVCETPQEDSRFEHGMYELKVSAPDRIDLTAESHYDWRLKGDHCEAKVTESRLYQRAGDITIDRVMDFDEPTQGPAGTEPVVATCPNPGAPVQIAVRPRRHLLKPGERVCLQVEGTDDKGCRQPVEAEWSVTLDGRPAPDRLSGSCFTAGETAADGEGLYRVAAQHGSLRAAADIEVRFPNISDLVSAKIDPKSEISQPAPPATASAEKPSPPAPPPVVSPVAVASSNSSITSEWKRWVLAGAMVFLLLAAGVAVTFFIVSRRVRALAEASDEPASDEPMTMPSEAVYVTRPVVCPTCEREIPAGSRFCPHDATPLVLARQDGVLQPVKEDKICPRCHRRYEPDKIVCAQDGEELLTYTVWLSKHGPSCLSGKGKGKICPICATRYESSATFCGKDGTELVTLN